VSAATNDRNYIPNEPDLDKLRLWVKNENGGTVLKDHAKMGNIVKIYGKKPPDLSLIGDQDGLTGNRLCNTFDGNQQFTPDQITGGQFLRIPDNPNVRIKELLSTDSITIFCRLYPISSPENDYMVLFSKIDSEQVTDGYAAIIDAAGYLHFIVRKANKERSITSPSPIWANIVEKADYQEPYFHPQYYKTSQQVAPYPDPIPFIDLALTCKFSDMSMSIIQDGTEVTTTAIMENGLVAHFRLNEGGSIGTTVQEQTPTQKTVYNSSFASGATNGTITSGTSWQAIDSVNKPHEAFLRFDGNNDWVTINNYTGIQNLTAGTISVWYYHVLGGTNYRTIAQKGTNWAANSWILHVETDNHPDMIIYNSSGVRIDYYHHNVVLQPGNWYHIVVRWQVGTTGSITVNGVTDNALPTLASQFDTGSTPLYLGAGSVYVVNGYIHDFKIWNRKLTDQEVASLYAEGHTVAGFPAWKADPPIPDESPDPITNPFVQYYNVPWSGNQAYVKLHSKIISGFTTFYDTNDDADVPGSQQNLPYNAVYDVQPSGGGGGGGTPADIYNVAVGTGQHLEFENGVTRGGVRFLSGHSAIGQRVTSVTVKFRKMASPGTISVGIRKYSDGSFVSLGTFNAASFGSGEQSATVTNSGNTYQMVANDIVSIEGGDDSIELTQNPSASQPSNTTSIEYDGSWATSGYTLSCQIQAVAGATASAGYPILQNWNNYWPRLVPMVNTAVGEYIQTGNSAIGKKITKIVVQMTKVGSPGGTIKCQIMKAGSLSDVVQIGPSKTAADIPTTQGNVTFEFATEAERAAQTYALVAGDYVGIEVEGGSASDTNYYIIHHNETSSVSYAYSRYYNTVSPNTGWQYTVYTETGSQTHQEYDMIGQWYDGGFTQTVPTLYAHIKLDHQNIRAAEKFATGSAGIGKAITKVTPRFKKVGSPTGSVSVVIRNSVGTLMTDFGVIDAAADIPAGDVWTAKDFTNVLNARTCAANDVVSVEYGSGDANNYVMVSLNLNHDNFDASLSYAQTWAAGASAYANAGGTTNYDLAGYMATGGIQTDPDGRTRAGQRCNSPSSVMRGKKVTRAIVALHKVGTPPADTYVTVRIRKADTDAIAATVGQVLASSLPDSTPTWKTVENVNNVYVMQQNDILSIEYDYGDDSNYVVLTRTNSDVFETAGNLSQMVDYNAPSYNVLTSDLFGELWTGGDTYTPAVDEQVIRDPFYHHDLLIGAGGWDWSYYAAIGTITNHVGIHIMPEFRIYRRELTTQQALNLFTNRCTISNFSLGQVAKVGTFGVAENT
jgi:hypothetical protein